MKSDRSLLLRDNLLLFAVAFVALVIDQVTKRIVEQSIPIYTSVPFIEALFPYFSLTHIQNTGAAFSLFQNGNVFFIIVAIIVSALIVFYTPRLPREDRLSRLALGLQLGGALGNLVDRLRYGYVIDFLHIRIPEIGFDWPVSNFADIFIVSGVVLLILASLRREGPKAGVESQTASDATAE